MARKNNTETDYNPLDDYPAEYAACRVDRHRWDRETNWESARRRGFRIRRRECVDCHKVRIETIDIRNWAVESVRYHDPKGFAMPRMGLTQEDYRRRHLAADLAGAQREGRVEG